MARLPATTTAPGVELSGLLDNTDQPDVCVAAGYGISVRVQRGHLVVSDGVGHHRRIRKFNRATQRLQRVLVVGATGEVTFEAIRWLTDLGIAFVQLDHEANVSLTSAVGPADPALLRRQALAADNEAGIRLSRHLLIQKVSGQAELLHRLPAGPEAAPRLARALQQIASSPGLNELRDAEATAATAYWEAWSRVPVSFEEPDRVPVHWVTFDRRRSLRSDRNRYASNPANAQLNYLYRLAEIEIRLACHAAGLDPGLGIIHADTASTSGFVLDLIEAVRPTIDGWLLNELRTRTYRTTDFNETRNGTCRVLAPLTHQLMGSRGTWMLSVATAVADAVDILRSDPLEAGPKQRARRAEQPSCGACGGPVPKATHSLCASCLKAKRQGAADALSQALADSRTQRAARGLPDRAAKRLSDAAARQNAEQRAWEAANPNPPSSDVFETEIRPHLEALSAADLAEATGLSKTHCRRILNGRTPHPRQWAALRALTDVKRSTDSDAPAP